MKPQVYIFGWPSYLGGADTKLAHLLVLLHDFCDFTLIPNQSRHFANRVWTDFLDALGIRYCPFDMLPCKLSGYGLALCNQHFFTGKIAHRVKEKGLKIIWSNEMMWFHEGELEAVESGLVDVVLYSSKFQREYLADGHKGLLWAITENYIDPEFFPFRDRRGPVSAIGRLSRPDTLKFSEDFPVFYERLELSNTRFRVMAWNATLANKYRWHYFDHRWDLLKAEEETQVQFLHSLDLFVYSLGHQFKESWGRTPLEATLTGCIPLVPSGHHFENLILHEETGFICCDFFDYQGYAQLLCSDNDLRKRVSAAGRKYAVHELFDKERHRKVWLEIFQ
jgi:hypothetical protein